MLWKDGQRDASQMVVLSVLADGPSYGYLITKTVAARSDGKVRLTPGVLYPLLKGLENEGLVTTHWEEVKSDRAEPGEDGRKRKWYSLSAKGRQRLEQHISAHRSYLEIMESFIGRLGGRLGRPGDGTGGESEASA
ncbi:MAG: PadR family transcriptional regulator [Planctomycetota bacterium]|nr:PadR family transcriptional regulator [Planctomycetota bacterium]